MAFFQETKILPFGSKQMFDLVVDIEKYNEFLPWCKNAKIVEYVNSNNVHAELLINFKNFFEKYTSDVYFGNLENNNDYFVDVIAIKGPFKSLINKWRFSEISESECRVDFFLEFEFNSKILGTLIGAIFSSATKKMILAFENRAHDLYNKKQKDGA